MQGPIAIDRLELGVAPYAWPFARDNRGEIDEHFAALCRAKPGLWNGRVLLLKEAAIDDGVLRGAYFETGFADFLAWRDWGFPDRAVRNCFSMGALRGSDGGFLLGVMSAFTANAGRIYFPAGTPEPADIVDGTVDLLGSVLRELQEETGLDPSAFEVAPGWTAVDAGQRLALMKAVRADRPAAALREEVLRHLATEAQPELADMRIVRSPDDFDSAMPDFVTEYLSYVWHSCGN
ncbi:MAG: NUDIX hydrolase [Xanthobacteraceae bacterium]|nr:NUDIX hydrolase [Xanthobacteraceae bacterium]